MKLLVLILFSICLLIYKLVEVVFFAVFMIMIWPVWLPDLVVGKVRNYIGI